MKLGDQQATSSLRNGGATTTRIHLFDTEFDRQKLSGWVREASSGDPAHRQNINDALDKAYIGFMTVRLEPAGRELRGRPAAAATSARPSR